MVEYFKQRELEWIQHQRSLDIERAQELRRMLERSRLNVEQAINRFYVSYADQNGLNLTQARQRIGQVDAGTNTPANTIPQVARRLKHVKNEISRLEMLKAEINNHLVHGNSELHGYINDRLVASYQAEISRQAGILGRDRQPLNLDIIQAVVDGSYHGTRWADLIWQHSDQLVGAVTDAIDRVVIQGLHPHALRSTLYPHLQQLFKNQQYLVDRLLITESARVENQAQLNSFETYGYECCVWIGSPDACERNCLPNINHNGNGVFWVHKVPENPSHPYCRCSLAGLDWSQLSDAEKAVLLKEK